MKQAIREIIDNHPEFKKGCASEVFEHYKSLTTEELLSLTQSYLLTDEKIVISALSPLVNPITQKRLHFYCKDNLRFDGEGKRLIGLDQEFNKDDFFEAFGNLIQSYVWDKFKDGVSSRD